MRYIVSGRHMVMSAMVLCGGLAFSSAPANAQFFNVDMNSPSSPPSNGGGVPSSGFGAAAGQAGVWNSYGATSGPVSLVGLDGLPTAVTLAITATSTTPSILSFNNPSNTGDFALLFNDGAQIGTTFQGGTRTYQFSGLQNGLYSLYSYGARPQGIEGEVFIDVVQSGDGVMAVTGTAPGNAFILGVTHVIHSVNVTSGILTINVSDVPGAPAAYINGFQLAAIPGPGGLLVLAALPLLGSRRRR